MAALFKPHAPQPTTTTTAATNHQLPPGLPVGGIPQAPRPGAPPANLEQIQALLRQNPEQMAALIRQYQLQQQQQLAVSPQFATLGIRLDAKPPPPPPKQKQTNKQTKQNKTLHWRNGPLENRSVGQVFWVVPLSVCNI